MNIKKFFKRLFPKKMKSVCCNAKALPWKDINGDDCWMCTSCKCSCKPKNN